MQGVCTMKTFLKTFFRDQSGASAAEYALILAIVGVAMAGAALALSLQIQNSMTNAAKEIRDCNANPPVNCPATPLD